MPGKQADCRQINHMELCLARPLHGRSQSRALRAAARRRVARGGALRARRTRALSSRTRSRPLRVARPARSPGSSARIARPSHT